MVVPKHRSPLTLLLLAGMLLPIASGCQDSAFTVPDGWAFWKKEDTKIDYTTPEDVFVFRGGDMLPDKGLQPFGGDFEGALLLFQQKQYEKAEPIFGKVADHKKNTLRIMEEARYYQAECNYYRGRYPAAGDRYMQLLDAFPSAAHGDEARKRLFDIANYWLDDTRTHMQQAKEVRDGQRWMVTPTMPVHWEDSKPLLDVEGHAIRYLEKVSITDPHGPLGEKALFFLGSVNFYRGSYKDAEEHFHQLVKNYPNGVHAPKALEMAIICMELNTGGPDYDAKRLQKARELIDMASRSYPELKRGQEDFLARQLVNINNMQAEKDFNIAKYFDRTGHPGSAHFYFEIVTRRYPGTVWAEKAQKRIIELRATAQNAASHEAHPSGTSSPEVGPTPRPLVPGQPLQPPMDMGAPPRTLPPGLDGIRQ